MNGKTLRLTPWHLGLWLGLALVAGGLSLRACLRYNEVAGTDKTPAHIATITVAVLAGPLVGPVANPHPSHPFQLPPALVVTTLGLLAVQGLALLPFLVVKRAVPTALFGAAWIGFLAAAGLWFSAALVSLGIYLN
jgi:hypothetical protein